MSSKAIYRSASDSKSFWLILDKMTPKIHFDETGGQMSLHVIDCPPGGGPPPHLHRREDESFFVLEGEYSFIRNDTLIKCPANNGAAGVRDVVHTFKNTHSGWSKMLCFAVGGPFEKFALEMADPSTDMVNPPPVTKERIDQLMALTPKYGIEMKMDWPAPTKRAEIKGPKESYWVLGSRIDFICTSEDTAGRFMMVAVTGWPNQGPPPHIHTSEGECVYIIDGEFEFILGEQKKIARAGDAIYVPVGAVHSFKNTGSAPARLISLHHGRGIEGFFREVGTPVSDPNTPPPMPVNLDEVMASALRNGMVVAPGA